MPVPAGPCSEAPLTHPSRPTRRSLEQQRYPWGDSPAPPHRANDFQGSFPSHNSADDGFVGTAPVRWFEPNAYGLYNMVGNVWEWVEDYFVQQQHETADVGEPFPRAMRGGSYMCHRSYCNRARVSARTSASPDSSAGNMGFRCAASRPPSRSAAAAEAAT